MGCEWSMKTEANAHGVAEISTDLAVNVVVVRCLAFNATCSQSLPFCRVNMVIGSCPRKVGDDTEFN